MLSGKKQIFSKTYFKDWAPILIDQYKKPKNMQRTDMIHQYKHPIVNVYVAWVSVEEISNVKCYYQHRP